MAQNANTVEKFHAAAISQGSSQNLNVAEAAQVEEIVQGSVNAENNAAAIATLIPLQRLLHTIVGLTRKKCASMEADGYEDFMEFENMQWDNIEKCIYNARNSDLNRGGFSVSAAEEKMIQSLAF